MAIKIVLKLGDFTFIRTEVPERITGLGVNQRVAVHDLVGGERVVDVMGKTYDPLNWEGWLLGPDASDKARYLEGLCGTGKSLALTWGAFKYTVVVSRFTFDYERDYKIRYYITCTITSDTTSKVEKLPPVDVDKALRDDMNTLEAAGNKTTLSGLRAKIAALKATVNKVKNVVRATQQEISNIKNKIQDVQSEVTRQIAAVNNTLQSVTTLGGIVPNNPLSQNLMRMNSHVTHVNSMVQLNNIGYVAANMFRRMPPTTGARPAGVTLPMAGSIGTRLPAASIKSISTIIVPKGTSLYELATRIYGDPTKWTVIAEINGLTNPYIDSPMRLMVPRY